MECRVAYCFIFIGRPFEIITPHSKMIDKTEAIYDAENNGWREFFVWHFYVLGITWLGSIYVCVAKLL